jgi:hypothetical protein
MKSSSVIAVGHACSKQGMAAATIYLETEFVALSPAGARKVAMQLLQWADHAETWKNLDACEREQQWTTFMGESIDGVVGQWRAVRPDEAEIEERDG